MYNVHCTFFRITTSKNKKPNKKPLILKYKGNLLLLPKLVKYRNYIAKILIQKQTYHYPEFNNNKILLRKILGLRTKITYYAQRKVTEFRNIQNGRRGIAPIF